MLFIVFFSVCGAALANVELYSPPIQSASLIVLSARTSRAGASSGVLAGGDALLLMGMLEPELLLLTLLLFLLPNERARFRRSINTTTTIPTVTRSTPPATAPAIIGSIEFFLLPLPPLVSNAGSINTEKSVRCVHPHSTLVRERYTVRQPSVFHTFVVVSARKT